MRIKHLSINNLQAIRNFEWRPTGKLTALIGENGRGKSSFLKAVRYAVAGEINKDAITNGQEELWIECTLEDGTNFTRIVNREKPSKVRLNNKHTTAKSLAELFEAEYGIKPSAAKIISSSEVVEALNPGEFGNFILSYIDEELDIDLIKGYISTLTPAMEEELDMMLPPAPSKFGVDAVKSAYEYFFDARKTLRKEIEEHTALAESYEGEPPKRTIEDVDADIEKLHKAEGAYSGLALAVSTYKKAVEMKKKHQEQMEALETEIKKLKATKPNAIRLNQIREDIKKYNNYILKSEKVIQSMKDSLIFNKRTLANLDEPICPISEKLVCTTDRTPVKEEIKEAIQITEEGMKQEESMLVDFRKELKSLNDQLEAYQRNSAIYEKKVALERQLAKLRANVPTLPPEPKVTKVPDYSEIKKRLIKEKDLIHAYNKSLEEKKTVEKLQIDLQNYNALIKALSSKGEVMDGIMNHYKDILEKELEERTKKINPEFSIKFVSDNGVKIYCEPRTGAGLLEYSQLSAGEKACVMFLIMDLLNSLSGFKILLLDNLEQLDSEVFSNLIDLVTSKEVQEEYDHIVLAAVDHEDITNKLKSIADIEMI